MCKAESDPCSQEPLSTRWPTLPWTGSENTRGDPNLMAGNRSQRHLASPSAAVMGTRKSVCPGTGESPGRTHPVLISLHFPQRTNAFFLLVQSLCVLCVIPVLPVSLGRFLELSLSARTAPAAAVVEVWVHACKNALLVEEQGSTQVLAGSSVHFAVYKHVTLLCARIGQRQLSSGQKTLSQRPPR